jgi:tetratricopeptide (TPR) repeat protein
MLAMQRGDAELARSHFQRAIELFEQNLGADNRELPSAMFGLAMAEYRAGRRDEARKVAEATLAKCRQLYGDVHHGIGHCASLLGNLAADGNDLDTAKRHFEAGLAVLQKVEGEKSREVATAIHNLGWLEGQRGDMAGAIARIEEALAIRREILAPDDPSLADGLLLLSAVHEKCGRRDEALVALREALRIRTQAYGADHAETKKTRERLERLSRSPR